MSLKDRLALYTALVSLVRDDFDFSDAYLDKVVGILKSLESCEQEVHKVDQLVTNLVPSSDGSLSGFIDSICILLSSTHSRIVLAALCFLRRTFSFDWPQNIVLRDIQDMYCEWKRQGPEVEKTGKRLTRALFSEGFENSFEQMLMNAKKGQYGDLTVQYSHRISRILGSNPVYKGRVFWQIYTARHDVLIRL
ncbi:hypothetical protein BLNAU_7094 [Blattamonas nauphoetae]|uniref:Uncharacterized protein n=1 Tax=Blattamonas nauphoetae TaxID=2049346 RepID=A0ABQ9Y2E7_9EUKA|nr:hypothetical protein BLNAU_7094 [Blattamonas nauphoetae]